MSNDVQSHEEVAARVAGEERRGGARHAARSLGSVTARIIGGSQVDLVNFSNRGVLFECDSRLLIGARASVRITTTDANLIVSGRVVRSRVKGLVNGALRYDAALVLDTDLGLAPAIVNVPTTADDSGEVDEAVAFESELDEAFDPSPVEAYLAESEASLLDVAHGSDLPLLASVEPVADLGPELDAAPEPPPMPVLASPAIEAAEIDAPAENEPIAFEADGDIAFEPAVEFAFDDPVEQADTEPAGTPMFDATYTPPAIDDAPVPASQFDVTVPRPVSDATPSSFFDAHPSESYGEPSDDAAIAFEAEDGVTFEAVFDGAPAIDDPVATEPLVAADEPASIELADDFTDPPAAVPDTEDRVLLQFAATVPHDLAELRRIAADNQW